MNPQQAGGVNRSNSQPNLTTRSNVLLEQSTSTGDDYSSNNYSRVPSMDQSTSTREVWNYSSPSTSRVCPCPCTTHPRCSSSQSWRLQASQFRHNPPPDRKAFHGCCQKILNKWGGYWLSYHASLSSTNTVIVTPKLLLESNWKTCKSNPTRDCLVKSLHIFA